MPKFNAEKISKLKKIDRLFKALYLNPKNKKHYPPINKSDVSEIALMGIWLIGDTIMHIPVLNVIKNNFPNARVTVVCEKQTEVILRSQNLINEFVIIKTPWVVPTDYSLKSLTKFFSSIRLVNRKRYDVAIEFRGDWRSILYMNFINSQRKVSYNYSGGDYMLTDVINPNEDIKNLTAESLYLLKQIGCTFSESDRIPRLKLTSADYDYLSAFSLNNKLSGNFIIGIHPGTTQEVKRWDENKYSELIIKLSNTFDNCCFIIYEGPNERNTVSTIESVLNNHKINFLVVNKSLREYVLLISLSQVLICNDSGAAHIAGAYSIPVVVIFGNRGPEFVVPYGSTQQAIISHELECKPCLKTYCILGTKLCLTGVSVEEVFIKTYDIINAVLKPNSIPNL